MPIDLPLDKMSLADKLAAMEQLWADLSKTPQDVPAPMWHAEILAQRRRLAEQGQLKFLDWDTAMAELRKEVRGNPDT
jgi:hypothetical protein